jgi:hypothetical protein
MSLEMRMLSKCLRHTVFKAFTNPLKAHGNRALLFARLENLHGRETRRILRVDEADKAQHKTFIESEIAQDIKTSLSTSQSPLSSNSIGKVP